jgi:hypothetical protein
MHLRLPADFIAMKCGWDAKERASRNEVALRNGVGTPFICYEIHNISDNMSSAKDDAKDAADKVQAAAKAAAKKVADPGRDTEWEYKKEKAKEKLDNL